MIQIVIISSLVCFGLNYCFWFQPEGEITDAYPLGTAPPGKQNREILWWVKYYFGRFIIEKLKAPLLAKPLFMCVVCMAGPYATLVYWARVYFSCTAFSYDLAFKWALVVFATAGLNRIIKTAMNI